MHYTKVAVLRKSSLSAIKEEAFPDVASLLTSSRGMYYCSDVRASNIGASDLNALLQLTYHRARREKGTFDWWNARYDASQYGQ